MNRWTIFLLLTIIVSHTKGYAQNKQQDKCWMGIWDYKLNYLGAYNMDCALFDAKMENQYKRKVDAITEKIESPHWMFYVLIAKDSMDVVRTDAAMKKTTIYIPEQEWHRRNSSDQYEKETDEYYKERGIVYFRDGYEEPPKEFLPDGHWLYFSTSKTKKGVFIEKHIENNSVVQFCKIYDLKTGAIESYFEINNHLLNGIVYKYNHTDHATIQAISRYKDGALVEIIFEQND